MAKTYSVYIYGKRNNRHASRTGACVYTEDSQDSQALNRLDFGESDGFIHRTGGACG